MKFKLNFILMNISQWNPVKVKPHFGRNRLNLQGKARNKPAWVRHQEQCSVPSVNCGLQHLCSMSLRLYDDKPRDKGSISGVATNSSILSSCSGRVRSPPNSDALSPPCEACGSLLTQEISLYFVKCEQSIQHTKTSNIGRYPEPMDTAHTSKFYL